MNIVENITDPELKMYVLLNRHIIEKDIKRNIILTRSLMDNWDEMKKGVKKYLKKGKRYTKRWKGN